RSFGDSTEDRVEVEHPADLATELRERRHLARSPAGLPVETSVLDRGTDVRGDRRDEVHVALGEPTRLLDALNADRADRAPLDEDRDAEVGARGGPHHLDTELLERLGAVQEQWLSSSQDLRRQTLAEPDRAPVGFALAVLDVVRELDHAGRLVVERHVDDVG